MPRDPLEVAREFFSGLSEKEEAIELLRDVGDRVAQFVIVDGKPFYVQVGKDGLSKVVEGTAAHADVMIETSVTACEEMLRPLGTSFAKARKESKVWTRPPTPWGLAWFGMLVRIGQGR